MFKSLGRSVPAWSEAIDPSLVAPRDPEAEQAAARTALPFDGWSSSYSLRATHTIQIALLPVGGISDAAFDHYASTLCASQARVQLDLPSAMDEPSLVRHHARHSVPVYLHFVAMPALRAHASEGAMPSELAMVASEWEEFHVHKRVAGVIGIIDCGAQTGSFTPLFDGFDRLARERFSSASHRQCFAFEPADSTEDTEPRVVVVPHQASKILFYLEQLCTDFATQIAQALLGSASAARAARSLVSPACDEVEDEAKQRRRAPARATKLLGDACLLAGSPVDALEHYREAADGCRANGDTLWLAGALEGCACALYVCARHAIRLPGVSPSLIAPSPAARAADAGASVAAAAAATGAAAGAGPTASADDEAVELFSDALGAYRKVRVPALELEACLHLAEFLAVVGRRRDALAVLGTAERLTEATLSARESAACSAAIAFVLRLMGMRRKAAHFTRLAGLVHSQLYHWHAGRRLLSLAAAELRLARLETADAPGWGACAPWPQMQAALLAETVQCALAGDDALLAVRYVLLQLAVGAASLDVATQRSLLDRATALSAGVQTRVAHTTAGLPYVNALAPDEVPAALLVRAADGAADAGPFIFSSIGKPRRPASDTPLLLEAGVPLAFVVHLSNPLAVPLELRNVRLTATLNGSDAGVVAAPATLVLAPRVVDERLVLTCVCTGAGPLVLLGLSFELLCCRCVVTVDARGLGRAVDVRSRFRQPKFAPKRLPPMRVVAALPQLEFAATCLPGATLTVLEGELRVVRLQLVNVSSCPVGALQPALADLITRPELAEIVSWSDTQLRAQLPCAPGAAIGVDVAVCGLTSSVDVTLSFRYSAVDGSGLHRVLDYPLRVQLLRGVRVVSMEIVPLALPRTRPISTDRVAATAVAAAPVMATPAAAPSAVSSADDTAAAATDAMAGAGASNGVDTDGVLLVEPARSCLLVLSLANDAACAYAATVGVHDAASMAALDLGSAAAYGSLHALLLRHLHESGAALPAACTVTLEPFSTQRVALPLPRFSLPESLTRVSLRGALRLWQGEAASALAAAAAGDGVVAPVTKTTRLDAQRRLWYKLALLRLTRLAWHSPFHSRGYLSLHELDFSPAMLACVLPETLELSLRLQGARRAGEGVECACGSLCQAHVALANASAVAARDVHMRLSVEPATGAAGVLVVGAHDVVLPLLAAGDRFTWAIDLVFLATDTFELTLSLRCAADGAQPAVNKVASACVRAR